MQSLCNNNVLGIVVNGARRGELYSKYTYYHSYYTPKESEVRGQLDSPMDDELPGEGVPVAAGHAEATQPAESKSGSVLGLGLGSRPESDSKPGPQ
jgi:hypothetical protein